MRVAIIAGHMSETAGKRTPPMLNSIDVDGDGIFDVIKGTQYREHYANVGVSVEMDKAFRRCGIETVKIGWNDENATDDTLPCDSAGLAKRQALVKAAKCDYSFSNHFNAFGPGMTFNSADGICVYCHSNPYRVADSAKLARLVMDELLNGTPQRNRDVHTDAFAEINCQAMGTKGSVLMEYAFMTNQHEAETLMANKEYWIERAEAVCRGFCKDIGVAYVPPESEENVKTKTITAKMNGSETALTSIEFNGENYIRIRDLADAQTDDKLTVAWDEVAQTVVINSK